MRRRRRGHSLIECIVVLALIAVTLGAVTTTLHVLYQADRRLRDGLTRDSAVEKLAAQLRCDAHQALSAKVGDPAGKTAPANDLSLSLPEDRSIQYTLFPERIERVVRRGQTVEHRETYRLVSSSASWRVREDRAPPMVTLVLELQTGRESGERAAPRTCRVDAAIQLFQPQLASVTP